MMWIAMILGGCSEEKQAFQTIDQVDNWCDGALGGQSGNREWQHDFAHAHVGARLFGPEANWTAMDRILSEVLYGVGDNTDWIQDYADSLDDVCQLQVTDVAGESDLEMRGTVAVLRPGSDVPILPDETSHLVIDLREVAFNANVIGAAGLAFASDQSLAQKKVRRFLGFPSQEEGWTHYESGLTNLELSMPSLGDKDIPLTFLTGQRLGPEASLVVSSLRVQQKAQIFGHDVFPAVAESTWTGINDGGLLWRSSELSISNTQFPDRIHADIELSTIDEALAAIDDSLPEAVSFEVTRNPFEEYLRERTPITELGDGERRAALLIAYGTLDWFYPYFEVVGRDIDQALLDQWIELDTLSDGDRKGMMAVLGRLMHSIHDGHGFYTDWGTTDWPDGYLGIQIELVNGEALVRSSVHPDIYAGDVIVGVEELAADEWYAEAMSRYSASSDWYRFVQASYELKEVYGHRNLTLRSIDGDIRTVNAEPQSYYESLEVAWGGTLRETGWLNDLDASDIFYVNMSGMVTPEMSLVTSQFDEVMTAAGVILDMRDYPYLNIYEFARRFNPDSFTAPHFGFPTWTGPDFYDLTFEIWDFNAESTVYTGPIILMVSNKSVSAAECFAQMLTPLENVTVVGQTSATTNGTITSAWLPGELQITWTGMDLKNLDGSDFHGIGIIPDVVVTPTAEQFADGLDPELLKSVEILQESRGH